MRPSCPPSSQIWHKRSKSLDQSQNISYRNKSSRNENHIQSKEQEETSKGKMLESNFPVFFAPLSRMIYKQSSPRNLSSKNEQCYNKQEYMEQQQLNSNSYVQGGNGGKAPCNILQMSKQKQIALRKKYLPKNIEYPQQQQQWKLNLLQQFEKEEKQKNQIQERRKLPKLEDDPLQQKRNSLNSRLKTDSIRYKEQLKIENSDANVSNDNKQDSDNLDSKSATFNLRRGISIQNESSLIENQREKNNEKFINAQQITQQNETQGFYIYHNHQNIQKLLQETSHQLSDLFLHTSDNQNLKQSCVEQLKQNNEDYHEEGESQSSISNNTNYKSLDIIRKRQIKQKIKVRDPVCKVTPILSPPKLVGLSKTPSKSMKSFYKIKPQTQQQTHMNIIDLFSSTTGYFLKNHGSCSSHIGSEQSKSRKITDAQEEKTGKMSLREDGIEWDEETQEKRKQSSIQEQYQPFNQYQSMVQNSSLDKVNQLNNPSTDQLGMVQLSYLNLKNSIPEFPSSTLQISQISTSREAAKLQITQKQQNSKNQHSLHNLTDQSQPQWLQNNRRLFNSQLRSKEKQSRVRETPLIQKREYSIQNDNHSNNNQEIQNHSLVKQEVSDKQHSVIHSNAKLLENGNSSSKNNERKSDSLNQKIKCKDLLTDVMTINPLSVNLNSEGPLKNVDNQNQFNARTLVNNQQQDSTSFSSRSINGKGRSLIREIKSNRSKTNHGVSNIEKEDQTQSNLKSYFNSHYNFSNITITNKKNSIIDAHSNLYLNKIPKESSIMNGTSQVSSPRENCKLKNSIENQFDLSSKINFLNDGIVSGFEGVEDSEQIYGIDNYVFDDRHRL